MHARACYYFSLKRGRLIVRNSKVQNGKHTTIWRQGVEPLVTNISHEGGLSAFIPIGISSLDEMPQVDFTTLPEEMET